MKFIVSLCAILLFSNYSIADQERKLERIDSESAKVSFKTADEHYVQAAAFVDGLENRTFVHDVLLADPNSQLSKLKKQIEDENCPEDMVRDGDWIEGCGSVEFSSVVQIGYGRGGWMEAGATYSFFVGFRFDGTGHFLTSTHLVTFSEHVVANIDEKFNYAGSVTKTLHLERIQSLPTVEE